jgi:hypothetical protein
VGIEQNSREPPSAFGRAIKLGFNLPFVRGIIGPSMHIELRIDNRVLATRTAFVIAVFVTLAILMPQLALSYGQIPQNWLATYAYYWPERVFPEGYYRSFGDYRVFYLQGAAPILASLFWVTTSTTFIYMTRTRSFPIFASLFVLSLLIVEVLGSLAVRLAGYYPEVSYYFSTA